MSTDAYVSNRAQEIARRDAQLSASAAVAQAESEMRSNVSNTDTDSPAVTRQELVQAAADLASGFWAEFGIVPEQAQIRIGSTCYVLYCFDLRIGQFFSQDSARRFVSDAKAEFGPRRRPGCGTILRTV